MAASLEAERVRASLKSRLFGAKAEPVRLGRFEIVSALGRGGMGTVYRARDPELERDVAVKILHGSSPPERLLAEARAMARLEHPNVVGVYEVGTAADRAFVVMELVPGRSLDSWLAERPRKPEDVSSVFAAAARGLGAAHAAGIVHRDFKPANVLVTPDGSARVADFGLAGEAAEADASGALSSDARATAARFAGTPLYMAPELLAGGRATPASDQWAFGISLYEALAGRRPFEARTVDELVAAQRSAVPLHDVIPRRLRPVITRLLTVEPAGRFESMEAVARALAPPPRRIGWPVGLASIGLAAIALLALRRGDGAEICSGSDQEVARVWSPERRADTERSLASVSAPFAEDAARRTVAEIDAYTARWREAHRDACLATNVRKEQSPAVMDRRMACLARRRGELDAFVQSLAKADVEVLEHATEGARHLTPVDRCADAARLDREPAEPPPEQVAAVESVWRQVAEARAQRELGRFKEAAALAQSSVAAADAATFSPARVEALTELARSRLANGEPAEARKAALAAADAAEAAGLDDHAADTWLVALGSMSKGAVKGEELELYERRARAAIARIGGPAVLAGALEDVLGRRRRDEGKLDEALAHHRAALALREQAYGAGSLEVADARAELAGTLTFRDSLEEAAAELERALRDAEAVLGRDHPRTAGILSAHGLNLKNRGRYEEAYAVQARALAVLERAVGDESERLGLFLSNLGNTCMHLHRFDEARALHARALRIRRKAHGDEHPLVALTLNNLANVAIEAKSWDEAVSLHEQALAIRQKTLAPDDRMIGMSLTNLGDALAGARRLPEAIGRYRGSIAILEKLQGGAHSWLGYPLTGLGLALVESGSPNEAIEPLERALVIRAKEGQPEDIAAETRFALARALVGASQDRTRAMTLAREARAAFARGGEKKASFLAELDAWLAKVEPAQPR